MATTPQFAGTPIVGSGAVSASSNASYTSPTNTTSILTGGSNGTKIDEIRFQGIGTTVSGTVQVFLYYNSTTYYLIDSINVPIVTASATSSPWQYVKPYANLILPSNLWALVVASTSSSQLVQVTATGGSF